MLEGTVEKIDKLIIFILMYTMIFYIFFGTLKYTFPFVIALIIALILRKPTEYLMKKFKFKSTLACLITNIFFFAIIFSLLLWGIISLSNELVQLAKGTQDYLVNNSDNIYTFISKIQQKYENVDPEILRTFKTYISEFISKYSGNLLSFSGSVVTSLVSFVSNVPYLLMVIFFSIMSTYFFTKDLIIRKKQNIQNNIMGKYSSIFNQAKKMIINYLMSYGLIIFLTFIETLIVFLILGVKYSVILSIVSAIADILPVVGIGMVYGPLIIIYWVIGSKGIAVTLLIAYGAMSVIRQIIEPKIVSASLGIHPVAVLAAIFIGLTMNGFMGMIFFMFLIVFYNVLKQVKVL
ncbi:sporulation integral membrane protein YtvI [Clostridiaceae bacterium 14S0207]|nr:sporulation integral membrane protein YtvI [Clostridiaceae bacterium 14S0207]